MTFLLFGINSPDNVLVFKQMFQAIRADGYTRAKRRDAFEALGLTQRGTMVI